jgi:transcription termination/antitermination protein NusA
MKNEFLLAFNEVLEEKQLPKEIIMQALESAMVSAYRKEVNASNAQHVEAKINPDTGKVAVFVEKEIVDSVQDHRTEVSLDEAKRYDPNAELGQMLIVESTPEDFGRVAAQTARQVIQQRIRDSERQAQLNHYQKQLGEIVSGLVQAASPQGLTIGLEMRAEGTLSRKDMIPGERYHTHDRVRTLIAEVKDTPRGPQIVLSRTHRDFLRRLLENEVPEIYHGVVEIRSIAREPGERAKVAVSATQSGIDPVGACVGIRGVRIQAIVRELHNEKIDVIEWNPDPVTFIAKAISPARVNGVYLSDQSANNKTATVVVPEDQLSLAIGKDGQNARLAAKLTSWRIDIKSLSEAASDAAFKFKNDPALQVSVKMNPDLPQQIDGMLAKKVEGRPLTPEEYESMAQFVDQIERRISMQNKPEKKELVDTHLQEMRETIPVVLFEQNLLDSNLPEHVTNILQEAGFTTAGDLILKIKDKPDDIFRLQGIGPRAMDAINAYVNSLAIETKVEIIPEVVQEPSVAELEQPAQPVEELITGEVIKPEEVELEAPKEEVGFPALEETKLEAAQEAVLAPVDGAAVTEQAPETEEAAVLDKWFTLKPDMIQPVEFEEEEDESKTDKTKKKKKKKKVHTVIEFDPDHNVIITRKKHKRGNGEEWEY